MSPRSIILDSSAWIELLNNGPLVAACTRELKAAQRVYVPTVVFFEVYKKIVTNRSEDRALSTVAMMSQYEVSDLTREIALTAADISIQEKLAMADSLVLAHARLHSAVVVTLDNDFSGISGARVLR